MSGTQAIRILAGLRVHDRACFVPDASSLASASVDLIGLVGHQQATDFHLVNLAAEHGALLATFDRKIKPSLAPADQRFVQLLS